MTLWIAARAAKLRLYVAVSFPRCSRKQRHLDHALNVDVITGVGRQAAAMAKCQAVFGGVLVLGAQYLGAALYAF